MLDQPILSVGGEECQEYSVAGLDMENLMSPTSRN